MSAIFALNKINQGMDTHDAGTTEYVTWVQRLSEKYGNIITAISVLEIILINININDIHLNTQLQK